MLLDLILLLLLLNILGNYLLHQLFFTYFLAYIFYSRHRKPKELDKNGGTWPKARSGPVIEHGTGTILHPRKNKERLPLSVLLNNPPSWSSQNNPKTDTSSIDFSVRSIF